MSPDSPQSRRRGIKVIYVVRIVFTVQGRTEVRFAHYRGLGDSPLCAIWFQSKDEAEWHATKVRAGLGPASDVTQVNVDPLDLSPKRDPKAA